jgi:hypothetical protein
MREIVSEKIQLNFIVKNLPNLFWPRNPPNRQGSVDPKTQRTPNSVVFYFRLGKELYSQDFIRLWDNKLQFCHKRLQISKKGGQNMFGYRCNQLPLIEKLPQWLSGPSSPLSVTAGPPVGNRTRFKWCSDAQYFYSTISIDDINAQSGW